jgi:hypothetical protein
MVGTVKDWAGSTTPALYGIGALCLFCGISLLAALPRQLKLNDLSSAPA